MRVALLLDPLLLVDDAVHERDLPRRPAKAEAADLEPGAQRVAEITGTLRTGRRAGHAVLKQQMVVGDGLAQPRGYGEQPGRLGRQIQRWVSAARTMRASLSSAASRKLNCSMNASKLGARRGGRTRRARNVEGIASAVSLTCAAGT